MRDVETNLIQMDRIQDLAVPWKFLWRNNEKQSLVVSRPVKDIRVPKWIIKLFHMVNSANNYTLGE